MVWGFGSKKKKSDAEIAAKYVKEVLIINFRQDEIYTINNKKYSIQTLLHDERFWDIMTEYFMNINNQNNDFYKYIQQYKFREGDKEKINKQQSYETNFEEFARLVVAFYKCSLFSSCRKKYDNSGSDDGDSGSDTSDSKVVSKVVNQENINLVRNKQTPKPPPLGPKQKAIIISNQRKKNGHVSNGVQGEFAKVYHEGKKVVPPSKPTNQQNKVNPPPPPKKPPQNTTKTPVKKKVVPPKAPLPVLSDNVTVIMKQNPLQETQKKFVPPPGNPPLNVRKRFGIKPKKDGNPRDPSEKYRTKDVGTEGEHLYDSVSLRF